MYACQIGNETFKGDNFPLANENCRMEPPALPANPTDAELREFVRRFAPDPLDETEGPSWTDFEKACRVEGSLLLNPYADDPESHLSWEADDALQEVVLKPKGKAARRHYQAAVEFYGLNRPEFRAERWRTYHALELFRQTYKEPRIAATTRKKIVKMLKSMIADDAPFAAMCRYLVYQVWKLNL